MCVFSYCMSKWSWLIYSNLPYGTGQDFLDSTEEIKILILVLYKEEFYKTWNLAHLLLFHIQIFYPPKFAPIDSLSLFSSEPDPGGKFPDTDQPLVSYPEWH